MAKKRLVITAELPNYKKDRQEWRRQILRNVQFAAARRKVESLDDLKLDVAVRLYMKGDKRLAIHDVDNRLKDILDALQGRFTGPLGKLKPLMENDNQVYRALVEKLPTPKRYKNKKSSPGGRIIIRPYVKHR